MELKKTTYSELGESVYTTTHESGLKIYIMPKKGFSKSYAVFATKYGSINTDFVVPGENEVTTVPDGVAHFLEHKVFEEEDGKNAFDRFAKYGASANAFTSFAMTAYLFSCTDYFYENLDILLDYVQKPYFTYENVEKEKGIIAQEIRMYNDSPDNVLYFNALKCLYKNHPARIEIAGSVESIMEIDKDILYKCYNTFYHPSNMVLYVVGDVDENKVLELVKKNIRQNQNPGEIKQVFPHEPEEINEPYMEKRLNTSIPKFIIGFKDSEVGGSGRDMLKREIESSIIIEILSGRSSPLYKKLYEGGLVTSSFGGYYNYEESFGWAAIQGEGNDPKKVKELVLEEIENIKKNGIDKEAFERQKKVLYGQFLRMLNSLEGFGNEFVGATLRGSNLFDYPHIVREVSLDDVTKRFNTLFRNDRCALSVVLPSN